MNAAVTIPAELIRPTPVAVIPPIGGEENVIVGFSM